MSTNNFKKDSLQKLHNIIIIIMDKQKQTQSILIYLIIKN